MEEGRRRWVYLAGAVPVRLVPEGTSVALALVAALQLHDVGAAGALIAAFTAPSVLAAPLIGAVLDVVPAPRRAMLVASAVLAAALLVAAQVGTVPLPVALVALLAGGCVLPVFLGGLSAFVGEVMPGDPARGFAIDALAYNVAGIGGPAIVGGLSVLLSPSGALVALAVVAVAGGSLLQLLPIAGRGGSARPAAIARGVLAATRHLLRHGPLARATAAGSLVQFGAGGLPIAAVLLAVDRGARESDGAWLLTAFAAGGVTGALLVTVPPITRWLAGFPAHVVMAAGFAGTGALTLVAAIVPAYPLAVAALALAGLPDAPAVAAMLRIRQRESPGAVRAQVFVVAAGLRVAASAAGAGAIGLVTALDPVLLVTLVAVPWLLAAPVLLVRAGAGRPAASASAAPILETTRVRAPPGRGEAPG